MSAITYIEQIAEEAYSRYVSSVIDWLKLLGRDHMHSSEDSPYQNVWEEFAAQIQGEESIFWGIYVDFVQDQCYEIVSELSLTEFKLLWYFSNKGREWVWSIEWDKEHGVELEQEKEPSFDRMDVVDTMYSRIYRIASNLELPSEYPSDDEL